VRRSETKREGGASLVEFALIAPLLFALVFGMLTGGLALSRKNSMTNAVREAARFGATLQESAGWASAVQSRAVELSAGDLSAAEVCTKLILRTSTGETTRQSTTCSLPSSLEPATASVPVGQCAVKVWARDTAEFNAIFFTRNVPLDAVSINRYERTGSPATCG